MSAKLRGALMVSFVAVVLSAMAYFVDGPHRVEGASNLTSTTTRIYYPTGNSFYGQLYGGSRSWQLVLSVPTSTYGPGESFAFSYAIVNEKGDTLADLPVDFVVAGPGGATSNFTARSSPVTLQVHPQSLPGMYTITGSWGQWSIATVGFTVVLPNPTITTMSPGLLTLPITEPVSLQIGGVGFGNAGTVQMLTSSGGVVSFPGAELWSDTLIRLRLTASDLVGMQDTKGLNVQVCRDGTACSDYRPLAVVTSRPTSSGNGSDGSEQPVDRPAFVDLQGYEWAQSAINTLAEQGIIKGLDKEHFNPSGAVSRAQFAALIDRMFRLPSRSDPIAFADVQPSDWAYRDVQAIVAYMNYYKGLDGSNSFHPNQSANRQDVATVLVRLLQARGGVTLLNTEQTQAVLTNVTDTGDIAPALQPYVATAIKNKIMLGFPDGRFDPMGDVTRAQVAVLLVRLQNQFLQVTN